MCVKRLTDALFSIGEPETARTHWASVLRHPYLSRSLISWGIYTGALLYFYVPLVYGPSVFAQRGLQFSSAGRKPIIFIYSVLAVIGFALLGWVTELYGMLAAGFLASFFGIGIFPILKLYIAEQYPTQLRGAGSGIGEAVSRLIGGVGATYYCAYILSNAGVSALFWFVAAAGLVFLIPLMLWGRETARISVEEAGSADPLLPWAAK